MVRGKRGHCPGVPKERVQERALPRQSPARSHLLSLLDTVQRQKLLAWDPSLVAQKLAEHPGL